MHWLGVQNKSNRRRALMYIACGLLLILADILFWVKIAWAAPAYTPYANSVTTQNNLSPGSAANATGAPDGQTASLLGLNSSLTLDMGEGEEGTNALKVYLGQLNIGVQVKVDFLDKSQAVLGSETRQLSILAGEEIFQYDWHSSGKAYRFVRISAPVSVSFGVDAVESLGFIGSSPTQDTDGDGKPDREDNNPLVPDSSPSGTNGNNGGGGSSGSSSGGGTNTTNTVIRTITTTSSSGATPIVNALPSTASDKDGDQMDDAWELANGLDPTNKGDAMTDPDNDGLNNLREYQLDTDPKRMDTDSDGIPDGWEVDNGLNAKKDDALEDPDGDFLTNLGETHFDSNPYSADDIAELVAGMNRKERMWSWTIFGVLLALAIFCLWRGLRTTVIKKRISRHRAKSSTKSALPPV